MAGGDYAGYTNTPETLASRSDPTGNTPDQLVITNRVKIDYAQDAGTYGDTLTYTVTPSY
jgi:spore coat protein U-like protein